jgi:hypothetical protein
MWGCFCAGRPGWPRPIRVAGCGALAALWQRSTLLLVGADGTRAWPGVTQSKTIVFGGSACSVAAVLYVIRVVVEATRLALRIWNADAGRRAPGRGNMVTVVRGWAARAPPSRAPGIRCWPAGQALGQLALLLGVHFSARCAGALVQRDVPVVERVDAQQPSCRQTGEAPRWSAPSPSRLAVAQVALELERLLLKPVPPQWSICRPRGRRSENDELDLPEPGR